jgi:pyridoxal phosphate enzyme (YggS family)
MYLRENLDKILRTVPANVKVVAISKFQPKEKIKELYDSGYRIFGENKAQELFDKYQKLPKDIEWHFVGHLQTNKVKFIAPFVSLIHSVDSIKLLNEINREAFKKNRIIDCLLQFHIASEETKFGLDMGEAEGMLNSDLFNQLENIRITGVMGMATFTEDLAIVRNEFRNLKRYFDILKDKYFSEEESFKEISMGMTQDYQVAIEEGSTIVRIGTAIFGER